MLSPCKGRQGKLSYPWTLCGPSICWGSDYKCNCKPRRFCCGWGELGVGSGSPLGAAAAAVSVQKLAVMEHIASCLVCCGFACWAVHQVFQCLWLLFFPFFPVIGQRGFCRQAAGRGQLTSFLLDCLSWSAHVGLSSLGGEESSSPSPWKTPSPGCSSRSWWEGGSSDCTENVMKKKKSNWQKRELVLRFLLFAAA